MTKTSTPIRPLCKRSQTRGSALLVTLLVVSLMMVLVIAFSAYIRVELRTIQQQQNLLQARSNALLGADMAIARLQEIAGADTRVTFTAKSDSSIDVSKIEDPSRRTSNWVGIRDAALLNADRSAVNPSRGERLGWLISQDPNVAPLNPETVTAWQNASTPADGFVMLVGPGSVAENPPENNPDFVATPKLNLEKGSYSWWVADEGVKARINLGDPFLLDENSQNDAYRHVSVQRSGMGMLFPSLDPGSADQEKELAKMSTPEDLSLTSFSKGSNIAKTHFHSLTTNSRGLPVNVPFGGLQKNLTALFKESWDQGGDPIGTDALDSLMLYQQDLMDILEVLPRDPYNQHDPTRDLGGIRGEQNDPALRPRIFPHMTEGNKGDDYGSPSWNQLVRWVNTRKLNPSFEIRRSNILRQGLWPVIAKVEWGRYITFDSLSSPTSLYYIITPRVVLWNPYSVPLRLENYHMRWLAEPRDFPTDKLDLVVSDGVDFHHLDNIELSFVAGEGHSAPSYNTPTMFDFVLRSETIPPGAAMVFTMTANQEITSNINIVEDKRSGNNAPSPFHLDIDGHAPGELRSVESPGEYGFYADIDVNELVKKLAGKKGNWPNNAANATFATTGLAGMSLASSGGGNSSQLSFDLKTSGSGYGSTFSLEFDPNKGNLSSNFKYGKGGNKNKYGSNMFRGFTFANATFEYDPASYIYTPGGAEIDSSKRLFHFVLGLRLPYNFSLANPGARPNQIAPARFFTTMNPLAARINSSRRDNRLWKGYGGLNTHISMMLQKPSDLQFVPHNGNSYAYIGYSDDPAETQGSPDLSYPRFIAMEIPGTLTPSAPYEEIVSPASLQHANLRSYNNTLRNTREIELYFDWNYHGGNLGPAYAIGNSRVDPYIGTDRAYRFTWNSGGSGDDIPINPNVASHYDYSYMLNRFLWDPFTFTAAANSRILWDNPDWNSDPDAVDLDFNQSTGSFTTEGAFNVNSTSVDAWAILLHSLAGVPVDGSDDDDDTAPFSRFNSRYGEPYDPDGLNNPNSYGFARENNFTGYRRLTENEILDTKGTEDPTDDTGLAVEIVRQVRQRGPFLSLADFVNRTLVQSSNDPLGHGLSGALQRAIDDAGINRGQYRESLDARSYVNASEFPDAQFSGEFQALSEGPVTEAVPGYLTQADLLSRIGAVLKVRSDTFKIRAYGETVTGDGSQITSRAWCEVTVQRNSEYVHESDPAFREPEDLTSNINKIFGRKYRIISFRWLNEEDV